MIKPDPETPVTDEGLARIRAICKENLHKGKFGVTVAADELLKMVTEFEQLRAGRRQGGSQGTGGGASGPGAGACPEGSQGTTEGSQGGGGL